MRLREFAHGPTNTPESNLVTALELLRHRSKDTSAPATISTQSLINLVLNTDRTFDYDALVNANDTNSAVKNLIKSFNQDQVVLAPLQGGDEEESTTTNIDTDGVDQNTFQAPVDDVSSMAKRAAKTRGAPIAQ
jgi:hypothetical protein